MCTPSGKGRKGEERGKSGSQTAGSWVGAAFGLLPGLKRFTCFECGVGWSWLEGRSEGKQRGRASRGEGQAEGKGKQRGRGSRGEGQAEANGRELRETAYKTEDRMCYTTWERGRGREGRESEHWTRCFWIIQNK